MDKSFKLSDRQHNTIYSRIEKQQFTGTKPVENPRVIITGGQPGSGKSKLIEMSKEHFADGNVVVINGDDLRGFHPQADKILKMDDKQYAQRTDPDSREWTRKLFEKAIETKRNIIFESTMREPGPISKTMEKLKDNGYHVTAKVVAANERESTTGIYKRYESQKADKGYGRFSELSSHDAAYEGMPRTVEHIEQNQLADRIEVYNRDGDQLYANEVKNKTWESPPEAVKVIQQERQKMPSLRQIEKFKHDWREINDMMKARQASLKERQQLREVESKLEKSLDKQLEKAKPTKQKDVGRLPHKEKPQERDRDEDLSR